MKRITVKEKVIDDSLYDLDGLTVDEIASWVERLREQFGQKYHTLRLSVEPYGYEGGAELVIYGEREENNVEYDKRVEKARKEREHQKAIKEAKKTKEYGEYLRLKEKFEKQ
jgi:hypothetical protein